MPIQRWRCPAALQVKSVIVAAAGVAVAGVFFPLWFGVPVMAVLGFWGLGMAVRPAEVVLAPDAGVLVFRVGLLTRRVRLADVTAVLADGAKVSIARSGGGEISVYAWRKSPLDRWLRIPVVAGEVAHAIVGAASAAERTEPGAAAGASEASEAAEAAEAVGASGVAGAAGAPAGAVGASPRAVGTPTGAAPPGGVPFQSRRPPALCLLGCTGVLAIVAAFLVRVSWPDPAMTALGALLALALGVSGLFYVLFALWLLVPDRLARREGRPAPGVLPGGAKAADRHPWLSQR